MRTAAVARRRARTRRMRQQELYFRSWGGRRAGAGRPRGTRRRVPHLPRPEFAARLPQHVTIRMLPSVWNMRTRRCFTALQRAMWQGSSKAFGFRLVHFGVMGNHIHMLVEAHGKAALSRGMQGLNIRIAKALNRVMRRHGQVLSDHYHAHACKTPSETINARVYMLTNAHKHYGERAADPFVTTAPVQEPRSYFLLRVERAPARVRALVTRILRA
jgi:putative transposase